MLGLLVVITAGGVLLASHYASQEARKRAIEGTLRDLGGLPVRVGGAVEARVRGITVRYAIHAGGKGRPNRTQCDAWLAAPTPLEMELRPETASELGHVEHGRAIDLVLGDDAFDDSFIVEAAPSEIARALLDRNTRTALLAFYPCVMKVIGTHVQFRKDGTLDDPAEITRAVDLCVDVSSRLGVLPVKLLEQRLGEGRTGEDAGYRGPTPDVIRTLDRSPRDSSELAALREAKAKRKTIELMRGGAVLVLAALVWLLVTFFR